MEFDTSDIRRTCSISLNENDFNSVKFLLASIRSSCKCGKWRNACGWIVLRPVSIIERWWRFWRP